MTSPRRRTWILATAAGAVALGAGAAWRLHALRAAAPGPLPQPVQTLDGRSLTAADVAGKVVVMNFWAPWCGPCVREMPELDRFARSPAARGVQVIGMAIDDAPAVRQFLAAHPVGFPVVVLGYAGLERLRQLNGGAQSALPFTAVFDRDGRVVQRKLGPTNAAELTGWIGRL